MLARPGRRADQTRSAGSGLVRSPPVLAAWVQPPASAARRAAERVPDNPSAAPAGKLDQGSGKRRRPLERPAATTPVLGCVGRRWLPVPQAAGPGPAGHAPFDLRAPPIRRTSSAPLAQARPDGRARAGPAVTAARGWRPPRRSRATGPDWANAAAPPG